VLIHTGIIMAAVFGTVKSDVVVEGIRRYTPIEFIDDSPDDERAQPKTLHTPVLTASISLIPPLRVPVGIPPVDYDQQFALPDPQGFSSLDGVFDTIVDAAPADSAAVFVSDVLDEAPERISSPPLEYPRLMRQAGIEGIVLLRAVVDTTGHVEVESIRVVRSDHRAFDTAARRLLERSLFRPGRVRGRPVRVLIQLPVEFRLSRR